MKPIRTLIAVALSLACGVALAQDVGDFAVLADKAVTCTVSSVQGDVGQPASPLAEAAPATQNFWYYCTNPAGYFPYVKSCSVPWKQVVPTPPPPESGK